MSKITQYLIHCRQPIVELGGPTPQGYELLRALDVDLSGRLIVTNITKEVVINPYSDQPQRFVVDEIANVRALPYAAGEIGALLVSSLPYYDSSSVDGTLSTEIQDMRKQEIRELSRAEYAQLATPRYNLHLFLYKEAARVLTAGGLLLQTNPADQDEQAALSYGLQKVYEYAGEDTAFVFRRG